MPVRRILGVLAALATVAYLVQFIGVLSNGSTSTQGISKLFASLTPVCVMAAISVWLLKSPSK